MRQPGARLLLALGALCPLIACRSQGRSSPYAAADASAAAREAAVASAAAAKPRPQPSAMPVRAATFPEGPLLAIDAGKGVGPIRIGANVATIERLMGVPCEVKTAEVCRYIVRAVEFDLKNGIADRIVVHRHDRPAGPDASGRPQVYGVFNGVIPPGVAMGMVPSAVTEFLGKPTSTEPVTTPNDFNTIERDTYPGMVLEFDRYTNGKVLLGGVVIARK